MHSITLERPSHARRRAGVASTPTPVKLDGVLRERGKLFLAVSDGRSSWMIPAKPRDLATCDRFCRRVEQEIGRAVAHASQSRALHHQRQLGWVEAIRRAYRRGVGR